MTVKLIKKSDRRHRHIAGPPGEIRAFRDADTDISKTMACGHTVFDSVDLEWSMTYDEYLYCLSGSLDVVIGETTHKLEPGDGIWLPNGTKCIYRSKGPCECVFAIYPGDWKERAARGE